MVKGGVEFTNMPPVGPFLLDLETIRAELLDDQIGVYVLGPTNDLGNVVPRCIGRSDDRPVRERICEHVHDPAYDTCTHCVVMYVESVKVGCDLECQLYHKYKPQLNANHPDAPDGTNYTCSVCWRERPS